MYDKKHVPTLSCLSGSRVRGWEQGSGTTVRFMLGVSPSVLFLCLLGGPQVEYG